MINRARSNAYRLFGRLPKRLRRRLVRLVAPTFTVGAVCVVTDGHGHLLLVRHSYRTGWGLPGGLLRNGERPADAGRRELVEELGLEVRLRSEAVPLVLPGYRRVDLVYHAEPDSGAASPTPRSPEILEVDWFALAALPALDTSAQLILAELHRVGSLPHR